MAALVNRSLEAFEQYKEHPIVKALIAFLKGQGRALEDVIAWECELEKINTNPWHIESYSFDVLFKDKRGVRGKIAILPDGTCTVHTFTLMMYMG